MKDGFAPKAQGWPHCSLCCRLSRPELLLLKLESSHVASSLVFLGLHQKARAGAMSWRQTPAHQEPRGRTRVCAARFFRGRGALSPLRWHWDTAVLVGSGQRRVSGRLCRCLAGAVFAHLLRLALHIHSWCGLCAACTLSLWRNGSTQRKTSCPEATQPVRGKCKTKLVQSNPCSRG